MRLFKEKVRSRMAGTVVSIRESDRVRIAIATEHGCVYEFCSRPLVKVGQRVKTGQRIGVR